MKNSLKEAIARSIYNSLREAPEGDDQGPAAGQPEVKVPDSAMSALQGKEKDSDAAASDAEPDAGPEEEKVKQVVDEEKTAEVRKQYTESAAALANSPVLIPTQEAHELANRMFVAMKGSNTGLSSFNPFKSAGTDESEIRDSLAACPTLLDASKVSHEYMKISGGATLEAHLEGELNSSYMQIFVRVPLADKPFIDINGSKMTHREFNKWVKSNAANVKKMESDYAGDEPPPKTVAGALGAAALGMTGTVGAIGVGGALMTSSNAAAAALGASLAPYSIPILAGAAIIGGAAYLLNQNSELDSETSSALDPKAYQLYNKFFEDIEDYCLEQSKTYTAYKDPEPEEEEEEEAKVKEYAPLPFTGLSRPIVKNIQITMNEYCLTREISSDRIGEDGQWGPETQGRWFKSGAREDRFVEHAIDNHPVFKEDESFANVTEADMAKWRSVSAKVVGSFPGYTSNKKGCLAFCIDAYTGDTKYGDVGRGDDGGGAAPAPGGGRRRKSKKPTPGGEEAKPKRSTRRSGGFGPKDITITVSELEAQGINSFSGLYGGGAKTSLARILIDRIKNKGLGPVVDQTSTVSLVCKVKGGKVVNVKKRGGQIGNFRNFERGTFGGGKRSDFGRFIMRMNQRLGDKLKGVDRFMISITFPAGTYDQTA